MYSKYSILFIIACCTIYFVNAESTKRTFSVIAPGATSVSVNVDGTPTPMTRKYPNVPYYKVSIPLAPITSYHYIADGNEELFARTFPEGRSKTFNDFFDRPDTVTPMTPMGNPFPTKTTWDRNVGPNGVFDEDYISTIIFVGGPEVDELFRTINKKSKIYNLTVAMINKDDDTVMGPEGVDVNIEDTSQLKPNMKIQLDKNYKKRSDWKLRPSVSDPVFMRDKLYNDMLESIGCPHQESAFARVYVNGNPLGFYNLQEKVGGKDFIKTQFYKDGEPQVMGEPLDASTGADFWVGTNIAAFESSKKGTNIKINDLINALAAMNPYDDASVATFESQWWDIEYFFRAMVLEYLAGHYDSYWFQSTNFVVYNDVTEGNSQTGKWYFIDQDFDQTLGVNLQDPRYNPYGDQYTSQPYTVYVNKTWGLDQYDSPKREMIDRLLLNPGLKTRFENIMKTMVSGMFNPIALNRRIDSIAGVIQPHIQWDRSLGESRAHQGNRTERVEYSADDFNSGMTQKLRGNWGLKTFIEERANFVQQQFGLTFINPPLDPATPPPSSPPPSTPGTPPPSSPPPSGQPPSNSPPTATPGSNDNDVSSSSLVQIQILFVTISVILALF